MQPTVHRLLSPNEQSNLILPDTPTFNATVEGFSLRYTKDNIQRSIQFNTRLLRSDVENRVVVQIQGVTTVLRVFTGVVGPG